MKNILFILILLPCLVFSQKTLPSIDIKKIDNSNINTNTFQNDGNPIIISFWATWCKPCILELGTINEVYEDWQEETNVKLIAISTDNIQNLTKVIGIKNSEEWEYEVYIDSNREFARAMGVRPIPHTFLLDENKNIVWEHTGYSPGDEEDLFDQIKKITNK